ncbi:hypothetical protein E2542_SST05722 [Spatholobus suberectus]|nr:hypothetical protein E2542_SST05722 [Spatholobus suberectus]
MYVTRPVSMYKRNPDALSEPPLGLNLGYVVIGDLPAAYTCFKLCEDPEIKQLPFPQDKNLTTTFTRNSGEHTQHYRDKVLFIPVLNQPLSSNCYYAIRREGKHQGSSGFALNTIQDWRTASLT